MAVKRTTAREHEEESGKHPWIQLLDLEQQKQQPLPLPKKKQGRPSRRFPRTKRLDMTMTELEIGAIDSLVTLLKGQIGPDIVRADIISFMAHKLIDDITALSPNDENKLILPESIKSFTDLANYLDRGFRQPVAEAAKPPEDSRRRKPKEQ